MGMMGSVGSPSLVKAGFEAEGMGDIDMTLMHEFAVRTRYGSEVLERRELVLDAHVRYLRRFRARIRFSGPILDPNGVTPIGGFAIFRATDLRDAQSFVEKEPFHRAGILESVELNGFLGFDANVQESLDTAASAGLFLCQQSIKSLWHGNGVANPDGLVTSGLTLDGEFRRATRLVRIVRASDSEEARRSIIPTWPQEGREEPRGASIVRWRFGRAITPPA